MRFSLSGLPEEDDLVVAFDDEQLPWSPRPGIGVDRWHYDIHRHESLQEGEHELSFTLQNGDREGTAQLCSAEILEFGDETECVALSHRSCTETDRVHYRFIPGPGYYGVFPT